MKYLITGDTHGRVVERINQIDKNKYPASESALIILGDAGLNYYLNRTDAKNKQAVNDTGYTIYCVRGNHEERPDKIPGMTLFADVDIKGYVFAEPEYPNIRYLVDGRDYFFNDYRTLVIGGAYSVDKWYRLSRSPGRKWTGWFADEQLTADEMEEISCSFYGEKFDIVLSHTCPHFWQPTDLFLPSVDQNSIDSTMEFWLDDFKDTIKWKKWYFGHFHEDRMIHPNVKMLYTSIEELEI